jgi:mRNA-degrading endonuclease YafQ of YafQ-DinJ toxin-antitoxin module
MKYHRLKSFHRDFAGLPEDIKQQAREKFKLFVQNPRHPSLRVKKMSGHPNIWEGHITQKVVFTFQPGEDPDTGEPVIFFRRIGSHDIYDSP